MFPVDERTGARGDGVDGVHIALGESCAGETAAGLRAARLEDTGLGAAGSRAARQAAAAGDERLGTAEFGSGLHEAVAVAGRGILTGAARGHGPAARGH